MEAQRQYEQQPNIQAKEAPKLDLLNKEAPKLGLLNKEAFSNALKTTEQKATLLEKSKAWIENQLSQLKYTVADTPDLQEQVKTHEQALQVLNQKIQLVQDMKTELSTMYSYIQDVILGNQEASQKPLTYKNTDTFTEGQQAQSAISAEQMHAYLTAAPAKSSPLPLKYEQLFDTKQPGLDHYEATLTRYAATIRQINEGHHSILADVGAIQTETQNPTELAKRYKAPVEKPKDTADSLLAELRGNTERADTTTQEQDRIALEKELGMSS